MSINTRFVWKGCLEVLQMEDRLPIPISNKTCFPCYDQSESHSHLFYKCAFSQTVLQNVLGTFRRTGQIYQFSDPKISVRSSKHRAMRQILSLMAVITYILRNERKHRLFRDFSEIKHRRYLVSL